MTSTQQLVPFTIERGGFFGANHETGYEFFKYANEIPFEVDAQDFSLINAAWLGDAAYLAYFDKSTIEQRLPAGFQFQFIDNGRSLQAYVAYNERFVILAFRGSETGPRTSDEPFGDTVINVTQDWIVADARVHQEPDSRYPPGKVHRGFEIEIDEGEASIRTALNAAVNFEAATERKLVWITGHSLGAAMATVYSRRFAKTHLEHLGGVYTFGSPRCGNTEWTESHSAKLRFYRFVHHLDIVTHVPISTLFRTYDHVGRLFIIDETGRWSEAQPGHEGLQAIKSTLESLAVEHSTKDQLIKVLDQNVLTDHHPCFYSPYLWNSLIETYNTTHTTTTTTQ